MELALIEDAAQPLVLACYKLEGDDFLAVIAYDLWEATREKGRIVTGRVLGQAAAAPTVRTICQEMEPLNIQAQDALFNYTMKKS